MQQLAEIRVRTKTPKTELEQKVGKVLRESDYNIRCTGPTKVAMPDGRPLLVYLPGVMSGQSHTDAYDVLHTIQGEGNRNLASGAPSFQTGNRTRFKPGKSSIIGNIDPLTSVPYCRTTAWTGRNAESFASLFPFFREVEAQFAQYVPDRYAAQKARADSPHPDWMVGGTVFTTLKVNNTYPTGVHTDKGDLDAGFSCLTTWRRGDYTGGHLTFPEWRISVDLQDGDLILMDAHQWHGNTLMNLVSNDAERISLVLYYRTKMLACGSPEEEIEKEVTAKKRQLGKPAVWLGTSGPTEFPRMDAEAMGQAVTSVE